VCGDGIRDAQWEKCDDGNTRSGDGCRWDCDSTEECGDGHPDPQEFCDDGNTLACNDTCKADCSGLEVDQCGDGVITACERCEDTDPTNRSIDQGCDSVAPNCAGCGSCSTDVCGDGAVGRNEECEPIGVCGDTSENPCSIGNTSQCLPGSRCLIFATQECTEQCKRPICGNRIKEGIEACDDGNRVNGDTCSADCTTDTSR